MAEAAQRRLSAAGVHGCGGDRRCGHRRSGRLAGGGEPFDAAHSRFGLMFFPDPKSAFANIFRALRPGGRLVGVGVAAPDRNPWMMLTTATAMQVLGIERSPLPHREPEPGGPGPFSWPTPTPPRHCSPRPDSPTSTSNPSRRPFVFEGDGTAAAERDAQRRAARRGVPGRRRSPAPRGHRRGGRGTGAPPRQPTASRCRPRRGASPRGGRRARGLEPPAPRRCAGRTSAAPTAVVASAVLPATAAAGRGEVRDSSGSGRSGSDRWRDRPATRFRTRRAN